MSQHAFQSGSEATAELDEPAKHDAALGTLHRFGPRRQVFAELAPDTRRTRAASPMRLDDNTSAAATAAARVATSAPAAAAVERRISTIAPLKKQGKSSALREFLTLRRGHISPASVGLKSTKARRSEGLTREDMAELTGVSFKWYTLFESGAAKGVSRKFAERVVAVLGLNAAERHFLLSLMGFADTGVAATLPVQVPDSLLRLVREIDNVAVALYSPLMDVLDANSSYASMFPAPMPGATFARNIVWRLFMDPAYRSIWIDWDAVVTGMLADFRYSSAAVRHTAEFAALMSVLGQNPEFQRLWCTDDTARMGDLGGRFEMRLAAGGRATVKVTVLQATGSPGVYLAALVQEPASR